MNGWKEIWKMEENHAFSGWDFSHLNGRAVSDPLPWDYRNEALRGLEPRHCILDMDTGGGEFLLSLKHPAENTAAIPLITKIGCSSSRIFTALPTPSAILPPSCNAAPSLPAEPPKRCVIIVPIKIAGIRRTGTFSGVHPRSRSSLHPFAARSP